MNKNKLSKLGFVLAAGAIPAANVFAGVFVIADDAYPAAKGDWETHLNWDSATATDHSHSTEIGVGLEFAYGATETLEVAASLDFGHEYKSRRFAHKTGDAHANDFNFTGISVGLKNQLLDPDNSENLFGLAWVGGFFWSWANPDQTAARDFGFELGLNLQKNFINGDLILAFTPGVSLGRSYAYETKSYECETVYSLGFGASYSVGQGFRIGLEGIYEIIYGDDEDGRNDFIGDEFYAGPNVCYEAENWWFTLSVAPRLFTSDDCVKAVAQIGFVF